MPLVPLVAVLVFLRFRAETAATIVILGGVLLLPARLDFDFPAIPPLGRRFRGQQAGGRGLPDARRRSIGVER